MKEKERVEILFEHIQDDVKLILEGCSALNNKIERVAEDVDELRSELRWTRDALVERIEKGEEVLMKEIQEVRSELKQEIQEVRSELKEVKNKVNDIDKKIDIQNTRIDKLEKKVA